MREILFRGKRVDNGEWVYGVPTKDEHGELSFLPCQFYDIRGTICLYVDENTVGQFTGLCDKNGKKIFEGDIVESPHGTQGVVEWQNAECAFLVNIGDDWQTMDDCLYEVVGNIYDNSEPLEVEE